MNANDPGQTHQSDRADAGSPRSALVTGGAGFIGSHLTDLLLASGRSVTVIDNLSTGRLENLPVGAAGGSVPGLTVIVEDQSHALPSLEDSAPFDEVYHLAAAVGVKRIIERPIESIESNVLDTAALLRFVSGHARRGFAVPSTLIASSSEVYGKGTGECFAEDDDCVYGPTTKSRWSYACSKAIDEYLALAYHAREGLPVTVGRFFNVVGPRQVGDYGMVLPNFVAAVLAGRAPEVYGDGTQTRCFCDVRDIVPVLVQLVQERPLCGRVVNIGADQPISMMELARLVVRTLAKDQAPRLQPRLTPYDRAYEPGFDDLMQRRPDLSRLRGAIDFTPRVGLSSTIEDIARSMRSSSERVDHQCEQPIP